jgi:hypothetical protein
VPSDFVTDFAATKKVFFCHVINNRNVDILKPFFRPN